MLTQETERNRGDDRFGWEAAFGASIELSWDSATAVDALRLVLDSDLRNSKRMPCSYPLPGDRCAVPRHLLRSLVVESEQADGSWETVYQTANNYQRLLYAPIGGEHRASASAATGKLGRRCRPHLPSGRAAREYRSGSGPCAGADLPTGRCARSRRGPGASRIRFDHLSRARTQRLTPAPVVADLPVRIAALYSEQLKQSLAPKSATLGMTS